MVAAGTVCVFHVGGYQGAPADNVPGEQPTAVPRWEFFIGDRPHAARSDATGARQPMAQISDADRCAAAGTSPTHSNRKLWLDCTTTSSGFILFRG